MGEVRGEKGAGLSDAELSFGSHRPSPISHLPVLRDKPHNISVSNALAGGAGAGILTLRRRRAPLSDTRSSEYGGGGADCGPAVVVIGQQAARARVPSGRGWRGLVMQCLPCGDESSGRTPGVRAWGN